MPFPSTPLTGPLSTPLPSLAALSLGLATPATPNPSNPTVHSLRASTSRKARAARSPLHSPRFQIFSPRLGGGGDENAESYFALGTAAGTGVGTPAGLRVTRTPAGTPVGGCGAEIWRAEGFAKQVEALCGGKIGGRVPLSPSVLGPRQACARVSLAANATCKPAKPKRPSFRLLDLPAPDLPESVQMVPLLHSSTSHTSLASHTSSASESTITPALALSLPSGRLMHAGATPGVSTEDKAFFACDDADGLQLDSAAHWADVPDAVSGAVEVELTTLGSYSPRAEVGEWRKARRGAAKVVSWGDEEGRSSH